MQGTETWQFIDGDKTVSIHPQGRFKADNGTALAAAFQIALRGHEHHWETSLVNRRSIKSLAILTLVIWVGIVILGRLIAYDHVWGSWSASLKA
jgi:hypothetical protein